MGLDKVTLLRGRNLNFVPPAIRTQLDYREDFISWFLVPGPWFLVPGSWCLVPDSWF